MVKLKIRMLELKDMAEIAETWFDTRTGDLLLGRAAIAGRIEEAGSEIVPIYELLVVDSFPFDVNSFTKLSTETWQKEDYIAYGKWVLQLLTIDNTPASPTQTHFRRMYHLGLGPLEKNISKGLYFRNLTDFKSEIKAPISHGRGLYDDWSSEMFIEYGLEVARLCGKRPSITDFNQLSARGFDDRKHGPNYEQLKTRIGGISLIWERLGYPNVSHWVADDYIHWGAQVMEANHGELHWAAPLILGPKKRGPSKRSILNKFETWGNYVNRVTEEYTIHLEQAQLSRRNKIIDYRQRITAHKLPKSFAELTDDELVSRVAKYKLARTLLDQATEFRLLLISKTDERGVISHLRRMNPRLAADEIERQAMILGVYDDIWNVHSPTMHLRIDSYTLQTYLRQHRDRARLSRRKQSQIDATQANEI